MCRYGMYCMVWHSIVCIICNSIYQYVNYVVMCATEWQNTFDTLTEWQSNDRTLSKCLYDSLPVCQIIKQLAIRCCLLLSLAIPYLCAFSVPAVCYLGIAFYCIAVNVLCCLCEDFCFLVLLCLVLCLVILLYYSNCIIMFLTIWYLLHIIIYNTIQYRKK